VGKLTTDSGSFTQKEKMMITSSGLIFLFLFGFTTLTGQLGDICHIA
jgi:hypothetical protein